ncbi:MULTISPECIES: DUF6491 family protein [unclassified Lysobacter]|uniref:DUF6491 family protein n=1 Tax=unclassified Lysobacter TaxID=2635362 RepID=UPI001C23A471|nr:DUF6491 family protein [Lysobacter sp. MMG2]MBU8976381.1 hypothetical protein [Lysobacter sp. MMG2]
MKALVFSVLSIFAFSACASDPRTTDAERLALYRANAGAPVGNFQYFGRLDGWTPLGNTALAIWTRPSTVYLLELGGTCQDLDFANAITVTNQMGRVYARFDKVIVLGRGTNQMPCWIQEIRPIDVKALRAAEQEKREAQTAEREKAT